MRPTEDQASLTPDERLRAVASILATAALRLHDRGALPSDSDRDANARTLPPSNGDGLEVPAKTVLSVPTDSEPSNA